MNAPRPRAAQIVPQRAVIVVPTTGAFDSRTFRLASGLAARGHEVTVLGVAGPGLAAEERHPAGYRILRVRTSAIDGLPPLLRSPAWRLRGRIGAPGRPIPASAGAGRTSGRRARLASIRRGLQAAVRLVAIGLTVRSQAVAARQVAPPADLIHAMGYMGVPVGLSLARPRRVPVIYDARDIYVDAHHLARMPAAARRLFGRLERGWARAAARVVTVNDAYADVMAQRWDVKRPLVAMNGSYRQALDELRPRRFHDQLGLEPDTRVVLYQGGFSPDRGIEQLLEAVPRVERTVLVLLGYGALENSLRAAAKRPEQRGRLFVLPAVPPDQLLDWVASADVVAMPIQPTTLNHRLTTPNKLFEAMAVGVPVVASDLPGMAAIVRATGCGVLCDPTDPAAVAAAIRSILDAPAEVRAAYRAAGLAAARGPYSWESQLESLLDAYGRLTGQPW